MFVAQKPDWKWGLTTALYWTYSLCTKTSACVDRVVSVDCSAAIETDEFAWGLRAALQVDNHPVV